MTTPRTIRKRVAVEVLVYLEENERAVKVTDEGRVLKVEDANRVIGAGGVNGMPWHKWVAALRRLGCEVNEHWTTVDERPRESAGLVTPVGGELADTMRAEGQ